MNLPSFLSGSVSLVVLGATVTTLYAIYSLTHLGPEPRELWLTLLFVFIGYAETTRHYIRWRQVRGRKLDRRAL